MRKPLRSSRQAAFPATRRAARDQAGLTHKQLADRLGKPQSFVSNYESGERRLDLLELETVCKALGVELLEFVRRFSRDASKAADVN